MHLYKQGFNKERACVEIAASCDLGLREAFSCSNGNDEKHSALVLFLAREAFQRFATMLTRDTTPIARFVYIIVSTHHM